MVLASNSLRDEEKSRSKESRNAFTMVWKRYLARLIDYGTMIGIMMAVARLVSLPMPLLAILCNPILAEYVTIKTFGNTLGKQLLGIRIISTDNSRVKFPVLIRCVRVSIYGFGLGIPVLSFVAPTWAAYKIYKGDLATWDKLCKTAVVYVD